MARRKGADGSIRRLPGGKYQARLPSRLDPRRSALSATFSTTSEARRALNREIASVEERGYKPGRTPNGKAITVGMVLDQFLRDVPRAHSTQKTYEACLKRLDGLKLFRVDQLSESDVRGWALGLVRSGLAEPTVDQTRRFLAAALNHYRRGAGGVASFRSTWGRRTKLSREARRSRDHIIVPVGALAALEEWLPDSKRPDKRVTEEWSLMFSVLAWSGGREGEILGLPAKAVSRVEPVIRIEEAVSNRQIGRTKTATSDRDATLPMPVWERLLRRTEGCGPSELVFPGRGGEPLGASAAIRRWNRIRADISAPADACIHDLRATWSSMMLDSGASILEVAAQLGHGSAGDITIRHYSKVVAGEPPWRHLRASHLSLPERLDAVYRCVIGIDGAEDFDRTLIRINLDANGRVKSDAIEINTSPTSPVQIEIVKAGKVLQRMRRYCS